MELQSLHASGGERRCYHNPRQHLCRLMPLHSQAVLRELIFVLCSSYLCEQVAGNIMAACSLLLAAEMSGLPVSF